MRRGAVAILASLTACHAAPSSAPSTRPDGVDAGVVAAVQEAAPPSPEAAPDRAAGDDLAAYLGARPLSGRSIGHTSVVFKLGLEGGAEAAYKPRSHRGGARYRGEIAAYRLGRALGIPNVPPALPRSFRVADLRAALGPDTPAGKLLSDEVHPDDGGEVAGAIIPWIHGLRFLALEAEPQRSEWRGWLSGGAAIPEAARARAAQISAMILFDFLTANWDRWSGGNVGVDASGETVLFIDNDGAFFDPPPEAPLARQRAILAGVARFSASLVAASRALDPDAARRAMGEEAPGQPLLSARVLAGLEARRLFALALVDRRIAKEGRDAVLAFE